MIDLQSICFEDLKKLKAQVDDELARREVEERRLVLKEIRDMVAKRGFSMKDILDKNEAGRRASRAKAEVKYRHPQNADLTWTGRGRQPLWMSAYLEQGGSKDDLMAS